MYLKIDEFNSIDEIPDYYNFTRPHVIRGGCKSMKIFSEKDKLQFFYKHLHKNEFNTEIYNTFTEMESTDVKNYVSQPFSETYNNILTGSIPHNYIADMDVLDCDFTINSKFKNYFTYNMDTKRSNNGILLFFGNNSRSGAHIHTGNDYILNQIYGKKTIYIFDFYDNPLQTFGIFSDRSNFLKDNIFQLDHSKLKIYKVVLNEGDSLTIPPWWWHAARAHDVSISVTKTYVRTSHLYLLKHPRIMLILFIEVCEHYLDDLCYLSQYKEFIAIIALIIIYMISYLYLK